VLATPLPKPIYIASRILSASWFAVLGALVMVVVAVVIFGVRIDAEMIPFFLFTLIIGAMCMSVLGMAVGSLTPSGDSAPAVANLTFLPIAFISEIFFPVDDAPQWVQVVGDIFPIKHFAEAMQYAFGSNTQGGAGVRWVDLAVIVLWGAIGAAIALRRFSWEPRTPSSGPSSRRRRGRRVANPPIVD
jgi:ABC-2 type transport system permease protein